MDDLRELLELLARHKVEFLVIGAHAVAYHGYPRATKDVDLWVRRDLDNVKRLIGALAEFGAAIGGAGAEEFAGDEPRLVRLGVPPMMADILNFSGSHDFQEVWEGRVQGILLGVSVDFPSRTSLISMKREIGRPQDLLDIEKLSSGEGK